jgi:hypothetical protein
MKKIAASLLVVLVAGCSGMGMRSGTTVATSTSPAYSSTSTATSGAGTATGATGTTMVAIPGTDPSRAPTANPDTKDVTDPRTGMRTYYHGG